MHFTLDEISTLQFFVRRGVYFIEGEPVLFLI